jgi:hypothetical protein
LSRRLSRIVSPSPPSAVTKRDDRSAYFFFLAGAHSASIARSTSIRIASLRFGGLACFPRHRSSFFSQSLATFVFTR